MSLILSTPATPPAVSEDLWTETVDRKTRMALRTVSDDLISRSGDAIKYELPKKILELTNLIQRSQTDESCLFHAKWDSRWSSVHLQALASPTVTGFSVVDTTSSTGDPSKGPAGIVRTTTRRFSISQQCGTPMELVIPPSVSVFKPPQHVLQLWEVLETHTRQLIDLFDQVQLFLIMKTPSAEEGNNTGVEIQQQCAKTIVEARRFVVGCESYLKLYHTQRAKIASKCLKYPQLEDYQRALVERDHEECKDCRYLLTRLRVQCIAVTDVIHKNFDKVCDPKGTVRGGVSIGMY